MATRTKAILLLLPLVLSSCGEDPSKPKECEIEDIYSYPYRVYYSDAYFSGDSKKEDIRLATLSMSMTQAMDPYRSKANPGNVEFVERIVETSGMGNLYFSPAYFEESAPDTTAFGIASKKLSDGSNLVWAFIGTGTRDAEWATNFMLGEEGDAEGFAFAAEQVKQGLADYIAQKGIEGKTSLYITGYSRCGGTANLLGGMLDDEMDGGAMHIGKAEIDFDHTYVYTVETPAASVNPAFDSPKYGNIHNYINFNDAIPLMAPKAWGFNRLGVTHCYPDRLTDIRYAQKRDVFLTFLRETLGEPYDYPDNTWDSSADPSLVSFPSYRRHVQSLINETALDLIHDRSTYAAEYEKTAGWLVEFFLADPRSSYLTSVIRSSILAIARYKDSLLEAVEDLVSGRIEEGKAKILGICDKVLTDKGHAKEIIAEIIDKAEPLFPLIGEAMGSSEELDLSAINKVMVGVSPFHERYTTSIWLMAGDSQYGRNEEPWTNDGSYYRLQVAPCRDFALSTQEGTSLFACSGGKINSSYVSASIDGDVLSLCLPKNSSYQYRASSEAGIALYDVDLFGAETPLKEALPQTGTF